MAEELSWKDRVPRVSASLHYEQRYIFTVLYCEFLHAQYKMEESAWRTSYFTCSSDKEAENKIKEFRAYAEKRKAPALICKLDLLTGLVEIVLNVRAAPPQPIYILNAKKEQVNDQEMV